MQDFSELKAQGVDVCRWMCALWQLRYLDSALILIENVDDVIATSPDFLLLLSFRINHKFYLFVPYKAV